MRKKKIMLIISVIVFCTALIFVFVLRQLSMVNVNKDINSSRKPIYELYVNALGNVKYIRVFSLKEGKADYDIKTLQLRKKNLIANYISKGVDNQIYSSVYLDKVKNSVSNKMLVLKNGNIEKIVRFNGNYGTSEIISDTDKGLAYVTFALQPASYNPNGRPYKILNMKDHSIVKPFAIKGDVRAYDIYKENIYAFVEAYLLGYKGTPDYYLMSINRDTNERKILNDNIRSVSCSINPINGNIYCENNSTSIIVFDNQGNKIKKITPPKRFIHSVFISKKGMAYVTHDDRDRFEDYKGNTISIYDTTDNDRFVTEIKVPEGCSYMDSADKYLFISSSGENKVISVIDMESNKLICKINSDDDDDLGELLAFKSK